MENLDCQTKYPLLFLHGMGLQDRKHLSYWGRIPKTLEEHGAVIDYGYQDASGSIEENALQIQKQLEIILEKYQVEKVNIIAHSKGGLEARYLVSTLKEQDHVASITTLATPHHGSKTVDILLKTPKWIIKIGCAVANLFFRILGDKRPDTCSSIHSFQTKNAEKFNQDNKDVEGIYYQSYAFIMKHFYSDIFIWFPSLVVSILDGKNDGLLTPESVQWGEFKGVIAGNTNRGISHLDEVDFRRRRLSKKEGKGIRDIIDLYIQIVNDLKEKGY